MKIAPILLAALAALPGCAGARLYRPGPAHAGLRSYIYEHTQIDRLCATRKRLRQLPSAAPNGGSRAPAAACAGCYRHGRADCRACLASFLAWA